MSATTFMSVSSLMLDFQTHGTAEGFLCHRISQGPGVSSSPSAVRPGINSEGNKTCEELMRVARIVTFTCARFSLALTVFVPVGDIEVLSCPSTGYTTKRHPNTS